MLFLIKFFVSEESVNFVPQRNIWNKVHDIYFLIPYLIIKYLLQFVAIVFLRNCLVIHCDYNLYILECILDHQINEVR